MNFLALADILPALPVALDNASAPSIQELVLKYAVVPLIGLVGPLLAAGLAKLTLFLHAKEKESKAALIFGTLGETALAVVNDLETTLRPRIQQALADGKLSPEECAQLKAAALDIIKREAPGKLLEDARNLFGPLLDSWLGGLIDKAASALPSDSTPKEAPKANP